MCSLPPNSSNAQYPLPPPGSLYPSPLPAMSHVGQGRCWGMRGCGSCFDRQARNCQQRSIATGHVNCLALSSLPRKIMRRWYDFSFARSLYSLYFLINTFNAFYRFVWLSSHLNGVISLRLTNAAQPRPSMCYLLGNNDFWVWATS